MTAPISTITVLALRADEAQHPMMLKIPWSASTQSENLSIIQGLVGGYVEVVNLAEGALMLVNEDGIGRNLAPNALAARMISLSGQASGHQGREYSILGDAVVVGGVNREGEQDGEMHSVPEAILNLCELAGVNVVRSIDGRYAM